MGLLRTLVALENPVSTVAFIGICLFLIRFIYHQRYSPLKRYPGPYLATISNYWKYHHVKTNRGVVTSIDLHRQYGEIVRVGPKKLSFANPKALRDIYGINKGYVKSEFYWVAAAVSRGVPVPSLFSNLDESFHAKLRRSVNNAFALTTLIEYEPFVSDTVELFLQQMDARFANKLGAEGSVDWPRWLQFYAFDVIGELTYSSKHGFLKSGEDIGGIIAYLTKYMDYLVVTGQMPIMDKVYWKNPVLMWLSRRGWYDDSFPAVPFAKRAMEQRQRDAEEGKVRKGKADLLTKFLEAKDLHPDVVTDKEVLAMALSMVFAGSETTAIALSSIFYYLLKTPRVLKKLVEEFETNLPRNQQEATTGYRMALFADTLKLPYLDACVKEAFRIHPPPAFDFERVVPTGGASIDGEMIPGGTIVSCNAWVLHYNKDIYGDDVHIYRPERWLEDEEKAKIMGSTLCQFGQGARTCIGKNISILEMYKLIPSVLLNFELELDDASAEWSLRNETFVKQRDFYVRIKSRARDTD